MISNLYYARAAARNQQPMLSIARCTFVGNLAGNIGELGSVE